MKAERMHRTLAIAAMMACFAAGAAGQQPGRSEVVRGIVLSAGPRSLKIRQDNGRVRRLELYRSTLVLSDDKDFSAENMPDIELGFRDLDEGDGVEVVLGTAGDRNVAEIVTRLTPIEATATARNVRPHASPQ